MKYPLSKAQESCKQNQQTYKPPNLALLPQLGKWPHSPPIGLCLIDQKGLILLIFADFAFLLILLFCFFAFHQSDHLYAHDLYPHICYHFVDSSYPHQAPATMDAYVPANFQLFPFLLSYHAFGRAHYGMAAIGAALCGVRHLALLDRLAAWHLCVQPASIH